MKTSKKKKKKDKQMIFFGVLFFLKGTWSWVFVSNNFLNP